MAKAGACNRGENQVGGHGLLQLGWSVQMAGADLRLACVKGYRGHPACPSAWAFICIRVPTDLRPPGLKGCLVLDQLIRAIKTTSASVKHGNRGRTYPVTFPAIDRIGKSLSGAAISLSAMLSDKDVPHVRALGVGWFGSKAWNRTKLDELMRLMTSPDSRHC